LLADPNDKELELCCRIVALESKREYRLGPALKVKVILPCYEYVFRSFKHGFHPASHHRFGSVLRASNV
jgi:hypothetical protein